MNLNSKTVIFSGGTACRGLATELVRHTHRVSYLIQTTDNGGSSGPLRQAFHMPAVGDIRSRLIDLADKGSSLYKPATKLLRYRLEDENPEQELNRILNGRHRLTSRLFKTSPYGRILMGYIAEFDQARRFSDQIRGETFSLAGGSLGNFFLTGAYLHYKRDLETAIWLYSKIASVRGEVIPVTTDYCHLAATIGGKRFLGQKMITSPETRSFPIEKLEIIKEESLDALPFQPKPNQRALSAIRQADLIVFSMGSFYTSIISTLIVPGIAEAIRSNQAPKVFIANPTSNNETIAVKISAESPDHYTVWQMAEKLIQKLQSCDPDHNGKTEDYLNFILFDRAIAQGDLSRLSSQLDYTRLGEKPTSLANVQLILEDISGEIEVKPADDKSDKIPTHQYSPKKLVTSIRNIPKKTKE